VETEALIFDLDDTLLVGDPSAVDSFMDVCGQAEKCYALKAEKLYPAIRENARRLWRNSPMREFCVSLGLSSWEGLCSTFEGDYPGFRPLRQWASCYRFEAWNVALEDCGVSDPALAWQLAESFVQGRRRHISLFADAMRCLEELSKSHPMALVTNGAPDLQHDKIDATCIRSFFKAVVVSGELGYGKPDRRIFETVAGRLGADLRSTWMIGDSLQRDVLGAKALGMKTAWVNRGSEPTNGSITPTIEVSNLDQLVLALNNENLAG
jgi:putative hydrolase of the HAD superfamily